MFVSFEMRFHYIALVICSSHCSPKLTRSLQRFSCHCLSSAEITDMDHNTLALRSSSSSIRSPSVDCWFEQGEVIVGPVENRENRARAGKAVGLGQICGGSALWVYMDPVSPASLEGRAVLLSWEWDYTLSSGSLITASFLSLSLLGHPSSTCAPVCSITVSRLLLVFLPLLAGRNN